MAKTMGMVGPTSEFVMNLLNELGADGWELVAIHALGPNLWPTVVCKRPKRDEKEDT